MMWICVFDINHLEERPRNEGRINAGSDPVIGARRES